MNKSFILFLLFVFTSLTAAAQQKVTGVVKNSSGSPLAGAIIMVPATNAGTISDADGRWELTVSSTDQLEISITGYLTQTFVVGNQTNFITILKEDLKVFDDVVVIGYGTQKKSVVTASISSINGEALEKTLPTRVDNVLKGQVSGVTITSASGQPGDASRVRIRGVGTIYNSDPLYIVDGMPIDGGIDYLNPTDIASVEVLKDAASAAVYGARAANGVILVTTKGGRAGKTVVNYNFSIGWQNPWKILDVLNAEEYQTLINETRINSGKSILYTDPNTAGEGTNWQEELFYKNAPVQNHQLSISGGNDRSTYYTSIGYFNQAGIVGGNYDRSNYERLNIRMNSTHTLLDESKTRDYLNKIVFTANTSYARTKSTGITTNSEYGSPLGSAIVMSPVLSVYAEDPEATLASYPTAIRDNNGRVYTIVGDEYNEITNPLAQLQLPGSQGHSDKIVASFAGDFQIYDNIKFKSSFGVDLAFWGDDGWVYPYYLGKSNSKSESEVWSSMNRGFTWQVENVLSYNKTIEKHSFDVILGQSAKSGQSRSLWGKNYGLQALDADKANLNFATGTKEDQEAAGALGSPSRLSSLFTRINYNYDERYMFQFTVRRDGSSNFGMNNKFATFPSISAGWNITNEEFMTERPEWLTSSKLRVSWGMNGNERIESFRYTTTMVSGNNYIFGAGDSETVYVGAKPNGLPNPSLRWEETTQTNIGADFGLFNGSLNATFDWYKKTTTGMLMTIPLPSYVGDTPPVGNVGIMTNSGFEFDLNYKFKVKDVFISAGVNGSYLYNILDELGNIEGWENYDHVVSIGTITRGENGEPFPYFYGRKTDGIFQNWDEVNSYVNEAGGLIQPNAQPGDVRFVDISGDGQINDDDRTKIGKGMPDWSFGATLNIQWRGFDFSALLQGVTGVDIFDATRRTDLYTINMPSYMLNRWVGEGSSDHLPRLSETDENGNWLSSDLYIYDGSYLRIKNVQLGYTLPVRLSRKAYISSLRLYVATENLFTFTSYHGFDPEIASGGTSLGIDKGVYPQARIFSIGANLTF